MNCVNQILLQNRYLHPTIVTAEAGRAGTGGGTVRMCLEKQDQERGLGVGLNASPQIKLARLLFFGTHLPDCTV
jgi:hypothetical protein